MTRYSNGIVALLVSVLFSCLAQAQFYLQDPKQTSYYLNEQRDFFNGHLELLSGSGEARMWKIYEQLVLHSGKRFPIHPVQTNSWGQAKNGGIILIDVSFVGKPDPVLAFIMAHEWAHQDLGHASNLYKPHGNQWFFQATATGREDDADHYAGEFLAKFGYDIQPVLDFFSGVPDHPMDWSHSKAAVRKSNIRKAYDSAKKHRYSDKDLISVSQECTHYQYQFRDGELIQITAHPDGCSAQAFVCRECSGDSRVRCYNCNGAGGATCSNCNGNFTKQCNNCYGSGSIKHYDCNGTGTLYCMPCNGSGAIVSGYDMWGNPYLMPCYSCSGKGILYCILCNGQGGGPCPPCGGLGQLYCPSCEGGYNSCNPCYSTGELPCLSCNEIGYMYSMP